MTYDGWRWEVVRCLKYDSGKGKRDILILSYFNFSFGSKKNAVIGVLLGD